MTGFRHPAAQKITSAWRFGRRLDAMRHNSPRATAPTRAPDSLGDQHHPGNVRGSKSASGLPIPYHPLRTVSSPASIQLHHQTSPFFGAPPVAHRLREGLALAAPDRDGPQCIVNKVLRDCGLVHISLKLASGFAGAPSHYRSVSAGCPHSAQPCRSLRRPRRSTPHPTRPVPGPHLKVG